MSVALWQCGSQPKISPSAPSHSSLHTSIFNILTSDFILSQLRCTSHTPFVNTETHLHSTSSCTPNPETVQVHTVSVTLMKFDFITLKPYTSISFFVAHWRCTIHLHHTHTPTFLTPSLYAQHSYPSRAGNVDYKTQK